jgi:hypothetical protein
MNYLKRRLLIQLIMLNAFYIFFFFCNILIRYNFIENQNCFHSMAYIFIRRILSSHKKKKKKESRLVFGYCTLRVH